jgi:hypothetical protein
MSMSPVAIVNVSPAVTDFEAARSSDPRNVPAVEAVQNEMCEYVSVVDTLVQVRAASVVIAPPEAAAKDACFLVVSVAALAVPAEPGSPVWSLTQNAVGAV